MKLAIIGAGMAGLTLASRLQDAVSLSILEKSGRPGGRMATRQAGDFAFDHGAQYFTARSQEFRHFLSQSFAAGRLQDWQPRTLTLEAQVKPYRRPWFEPHWVPVPAMNSLARDLPVAERIEFRARVTALQQSPAGWQVLLENGQHRGPFDWVVITAPAPQSLALLPDEFAARQQLEQVRMAGCYSLMLGFRTPLSLPFDAATVRNSPLSWLSVDSAKPGRGSQFSLLAQSSNGWADAHLDQSPAWVTGQLLAALQKLLPDLPEADHCDLHRWRYAATTRALEQDFLLDPALRLAACGDWCLGGRVEAAFSSANRLADALLARC